ncbi:MAG: hypothetical protein OQK35_00885 [Alphaproteobacteria bacterium]|nr:hypothetical protein [Alphaproteobacteria bacterium]
MPLAFQSLSHGEVAFGFYNIETDALLLDNLFFFAIDFCPAVVTLKEKQSQATIHGHTIETREKMGDLMGAIHGLHHAGYLGELYQLWPFPRDPSLFRQKLDGHQRRKETLAVLEKYAEPQEVTLGPLSPEQISIGPYIFTEAQFQELVAYIWRGGHPTWEGFEKGKWPDYMQEMVQLYGLA